MTIWEFYGLTEEEFKALCNRLDRACETGKDWELTIKVGDKNEL